MYLKKIIATILFIILVISNCSIVMATTVNQIIDGNDNTNIGNNEEVINNTVNNETVTEELELQENNEKINELNIVEEKDINTEIIVEDSNIEVDSKTIELLKKVNIDNVEQLSTKISKQQMIEILKAKANNINDNVVSNENGIFIEENFRELILQFINNHASYTYSVDENGFLICDNTLKVNERLDLAEPVETEMDIALRDITENNKNILITISENCYNFKNDLIVNENFDNDVKSKAYENENLRLVILNADFYNNEEIEYNLPLSDNFIKILNDTQYKVLSGEITLSVDPISDNDASLLSISLTDNGQAIGMATMGQTVYSGPNNNGTYCTVGSIDRFEEIAILGSEGAYYHINYAVTGTSNEKTGYVLKENITTLGTITEEIMTGGYRYANQNVNIQSRGLYSVAVSYGSISNTEGVTLLYDYNINHGSEVYRVGFVEIWTGNGMKRGYVKMQYLENPFTTKLAKASQKVTTYTGPNTSRFTAGTGAIGVNEYACVLGYTGDYLFIEYNTNTGRRRAFCNKSNLGISSPSSLGVQQLPTLQMSQGYIASQGNDVSAGPGTAYSLCAYVGAIGQKENVYRQSTSGTNPYNQLGYTYIVYYAGESLKGGFVPASILTQGQNPVIPDLPSSVGQTGGFQQVTHWQSGLGGPIGSYKLGTGDKRLYLIYAQHGFEDEGYGDGIEVVDIAYNFINYMYNNRNTTNVQTVLNEWTIYMVPYLNRDGITSGSSEFGPGRCNVKDEIDINRNWPTEIYVPYLTKGRNYTGPTQLATVEAQGLRDTLMRSDVKPVDGATSILLDIHGWDCETIGDTGVGSYYYDQFKNDSTTSFLSHSGSHAFQCRTLTSSAGSSGYLAQWAVENGIDKSIILELPSHNSRVTGGRSLSDRFNTATMNLLLGE